MKKTQTVAILITVHNHLEKTKKCLNALANQKLDPDTSLEIYITCDQCQDNTFEELKRNPFKIHTHKLHLQKSETHLYWGGGTNLAWDKALEAPPDYFLLLNQDTFLKPEALQTLLTLAREMNNETILAGKTQGPKDQNTTYGGITYRTMKDFPGHLVNNTTLQEVKLANGNILLIPFNIYQKLGTLCKKYPHRFADLEYTHRAHINNIKIFVPQNPLGECDRNPKPLDPNKTWIQRLIKPTELDAPSYLRFLWSYTPQKIPLAIIKLLAKATFPTIKEIIPKLCQKKSKNL